MDKGMDMIRARHTRISITTEKSRNGRLYTKNQALPTESTGVLLYPGGIVGCWFPVWQKEATYVYQR